MNSLCNIIISCQLQAFKVYIEKTLENIEFSPIFVNSFNFETNSRLQFALYFFQFYKVNSIFRVFH